MIDYLAVFANVADPERPWQWRGAQQEVRDGLYRSLEAEQAAAAIVRYPGEAARILALAQAAFGDLRGLLAGLPDDVLDRVPREGEWPLRLTLHHMLHRELTFRANTAYALERSTRDPLGLEVDQVPSAVGPTSPAGSRTSWSATALRGRPPTPASNRLRRNRCSCPPSGAATRSTCASG